MVVNPCILNNLDNGCKIQTNDDIFVKVTECTPVCYSKQNANTSAGMIYSSHSNSLLDFNPDRNAKIIECHIAFLKWIQKIN